MYGEVIINDPKIIKRVGGGGDGDDVGAQMNGDDCCR